MLKQIGDYPRNYIIGFIAPLFSLMGIVLAISISPNFDWFNNALSDLGHYTRTDLGPYQLASAVIFNGGLLISGSLMTWFAYTLIKKTESIIKRFGLVISAFSTICLFFVGVFSENFGILHGLSAIGYFLSIPAAIGVVGLSWIRYAHLRYFGILFLLTPIGYFYVIFQPWSGIAIPEIILATFGIIWIWGMNVLYYTERVQKPDENQ